VEVSTEVEEVSVEEVRVEDKIQMVSLRTKINNACNNVAQMALIQWYQTKEK